MLKVTSDEYKERKLLTDGQLHWLRQHDNEVQRWLDNNVSSRHDWLDMYRKIVSDKYRAEQLAYFFYLYLTQKQDYNPYRRLDDICRKILSPRGGHVNVMIGGRGSGKTGLSYTLTEHMNRRFKKDIWWLGAPAHLPKFIAGSTLEYDNLPPNVVVLADESGVNFNAREGGHADNIDITKKLAIISHAGRDIIFTTQATGITDISIFRLASSLIFTAPIFLSIRKERLVFNEYLNYFMPQKPGQALYFDNTTLMELQVGLPLWWNNSYSTPYRPFKDSAEAYRFILLCMKDVDMTKDYAISKIQELLSIRSYTLSESRIMYVKRLADSFGLDNLLALEPNKLYDTITQGYDDSPIQDIIDRTLKGTKPVFKKYNFKQDPFSKADWEKQFQRHPELWVQTEINFNKEFIKYIEDSRHHDHTIIAIWGLTGSGKSRSGMAIAECMGMILGKEWSAKNDYFNPSRQHEEGLLHNLPNVGAFDTMILDEQIKRHGQGSNIERAELQAVEETLRAEQINFIFISTSVKTTNHRFILKTWGIDYKAGVAKLIVFSPDNTCMGYITVRKPTEENELIYAERKKKYTTDVKTGKATSTTVDLNHIVLEMEKDENYPRQERGKDKKIGYIMRQHPELTQPQAFTIWTMIREN